MKTSAHRPVFNKRIIRGAPRPGPTPGDLAPPPCSSTPAYQVDWRGLGGLPSGWVLDVGSGTPTLDADGLGASSSMLIYRPIAVPYSSQGHTIAIHTSHTSDVFHGLIGVNSAMDFSLRTSVDFDSTIVDPAATINATVASPSSGEFIVVARARQVPSFVGARLSVYDTAGSLLGSDTDGTGFSGTPFSATDYVILLTGTDSAMRLQRTAWWPCAMSDDQMADFVADWT